MTPLGLRHCHPQQLLQLYVLVLLLLVHDWLADSDSC